MDNCMYFETYDGCFNCPSIEQCERRNENVLDEE
jgi:hypothetical protein